MEAAVSVKLAGVFGQLTSLDVLEDACFLRLQVEVKDRPLAFAGPHSSRNFWQPEAIG